MWRASSPLDLMIAGIRTGQVLIEAQTVIALRLAGLAGLWPVRRSEGLRMWTEKPGAFFEAGGAAARALMAGKRPDQVAEAALRPLRHKVRANSRRLSRSGRRK